MGKETDRIRNEIEETRTEMSGTIQEMARRTDVPRRIKSMVRADEGGHPLLASFAAGILTGLFIARKLGHSRTGRSCRRNTGGRRLP